ncbi:MAG: site-2 protease family protein [Chloroflexi bacterium]|nr:site-2 protease family protein [Chloroflexota bacterium]
MPLFGPIDWQRTIDMIIILLIAIDIHELAHAVVADRLGDPTPRRLGELSLNPFVHMDQIGVILLILTSIGSFAFTYGRTHVTPSNLKYGPQRGNAIVAIAGPLSNLALAALLVVPLRLEGTGAITLSPQVNFFLYLAVALNILLFVLNLLPIPPLDGFTVLGGFLTARQMYSLAPLQQWGPLIILLLFIFEPQTHILGSTLSPAIDNIYNFLCPITSCGITS